MTATFDKYEPVKCIACGKFVACSEMVEGGGARFHFVPDSQFGPEEHDWACKACVEKKQ